MGRIDSLVLIGLTPTFPMGVCGRRGLVRFKNIERIFNASFVVYLCLAIFKNFLISCIDYFSMLMQKILMSGAGFLETLLFFLSLPSSCRTPENENSISKTFWYHPIKGRRTHIYRKADILENTGPVFILF